MIDHLDNYDLDSSLFLSHGSLKKFSVITPNLYGSPTTKSLLCKKLNDQLYFEGDIILKPNAPFTLFGNLIHRFGILGHIVEETDSLWPEGKIPYAVAYELQELVTRAITHWESHTPIRFIKFTGQQDYLTFLNLGQNGSSIGRQGDKQVVSLLPNASIGTAIHEIGHALGLWHEHSRSDRDDYVQVHYENISEIDHPQFDQPIQNAENLGVYDFQSIMHYSGTAYSNNEEPTITTIDGQSIGQRNGLSSGDIAAINALYSAV
ncbi:MAG: M12 family metallopeptidase [Candidatus Thiodiazotropha endolucinida]